MDKDDRAAAERIALENALVLLVQMLDDKGILKRHAYRDALADSGADLAMKSPVALAQHAGRKMVDLTKRL